MRTRILVFFVALTLFFFLSGCFSQSENRDEYIDGRLKITFWHAMGGPIGDILNRLIREFNKSQDQYYVHTEFMGRYDILEQKIIASVMAGKTPDISQMYEGVTMFLTRDRGEESLQDLRPLVSKWDGFEDIFPIMRENGTFDGAVYAIPFNKSFPVLWYNRDMLSMLGLQEPPKTWEELASMSEKVQKNLVYDETTKTPVLRTGVEDTRDPIKGYEFAIDPWYLSIMILQNGGSLMDYEKNKVDFANELSVEAMNWYVRGINEGWAYRTEGYNHQNDYSAQKVAFIITTSVSQKFMEKKLFFDYGIAPIPMGKVKKTSIISGTNICMFSGIGEKRTKGAWEFIKWLSSPEISARWAVESFYVPVRRAALQMDFMKEHMQKKGGMAAIDQIEISEMEPRSPAWYRCRIHLRATMEKIISIVEKSQGKNLDTKALIRQHLKESNDYMNRELSKYK